MTTFVGFVFTVVGSNVAFGTAGTDGATSSDALWWSPSINETLEWPEITISERAKPLDGDCDVEPITLTVVDDGTASEQFAMDAASNPSSPIASSVSDSDTTIAVLDGSLFTAGDDAWIERECVNITSIASNTLTVTRGKYGSQAVAHLIDEDNGSRPEVFSRPAWLGVQRHAYLWGVEENGNAVCLWIGLLKRPPLRDGDAFALECDSLLSVVRTARVLDEYSGTQLVGVGTSGVPIASVALSTNLSGVPTMTASTTGTRFRGGVREALDDLADAVAATFTLHSVTPGQLFVVPRTSASARVVVTWEGNPSEPYSGTMQVLGIGESGLGAITAQAINDGTTRAFTWEVQWPPCGYLVTPAWGGAQTFFVRSTDSLPLTWDGSDVTTDGRVTRVNRVLRGELSDQWHVVFSGISVDDSLGEITATTSFFRRDAGAEEFSLPIVGRVGVITRPALQVALQVTCDCWADGWRYGVLPELSRDTWDDHWDWSRLTTIARATSSGLFGRRTQFYDGALAVGDLLAEDCFVAGCTPVVRAGGRLALWDWSIPLATETPVMTYTSASLVGDSQPWDLWTEGFANSVKVKAGRLDLQVNTTRSVRRFGRGRELSIELKGIDAEQLRNLDASDLKHTFLRRLQLWSEPIYQVTLEVPLTDCQNVFCGDTISVSDWVAPNGAGGRGLSGALAKVFARHLDISTGVLRLECLLFGRIAHGYAPVCKADSVVSSKTLAFESNPMGSTDYAGASGTGLSYFAATNVVELVERDAVSPLTQTLTIDAISSPNVTFTTDVDLAIRTAITGGAWFSMRPTTFSGASVAHQKYAFVGDDTTDVIDSTSTPSRRIAP